MKSIVFLIGRIIVSRVQCPHDIAQRLAPIIAEVGLALSYELKLHIGVGLLHTGDEVEEFLVQVAQVFAYRRGNGHVAVFHVLDKHFKVNILVGHQLAHQVSHLVVALFFERRQDFIFKTSRSRSLAAM